MVIVGTRRHPQLGSIVTQHQGKWFVFLGILNFSEGSFSGLKWSFGLNWSFCLKEPGHLVVLVAKEYSSRAEDPGFESSFQLDFFQVESYQ